VSDIFKKYQAQLKSYIAKRVSRQEDREDIFQDVFYQLSKIDLDENPIEQISSWLYAVARNKIIDKSRKKRELSVTVNMESSEEDEFLVELTDLLFDEDSSPETEYLKSLVWVELEEALKELPTEQRTVFELTELEGISFKEISESTGVTVNTLISRKRYAVLHLRNKLSGIYNDLFGE
jgi:RNA polymerase sigma factor (sigma-70 family)